MNNKKLLNVITFVALIGLIAFSFYKNYKEDEERQTPQEQPKIEVPTKREESEIEEGYVIVIRTESNNNNKRTITRFYSTGEVEKCVITEDTVIKSDYQEKYARVGTMTDSELKSLRETINKLKDQEMKKDDLSESYGITIRVNNKKDIFYSAEYYDQKDVNTIYNIIKNY